MKKHFAFAFFLSFLFLYSFSQNDSLPKNQSSIFEKITSEMAQFKPDTTTPPTDKITKAIIEVRTLRGGFNINEDIEFKIAEDKQKGDLSKEAGEKLADYFQSGNGKKWLDNAVIWIYRKHFSYNELKQLVKFYKTSAGQKMATVSPVIMLQSLAAAEMIKKLIL